VTERESAGRKVRRLSRGMHLHLQYGCHILSAILFAILPRWLTSRHKCDDVFSLPFLSLSLCPSRRYLRLTVTRDWLSLSSRILDSREIITCSPHPRLTLIARCTHDEVHLPRHLRQPKRSSVIRHTEEQDSANRCRHNARTSAGRSRMENAPRRHGFS